MNAKLMILNKSEDWHLHQMKLAEETMELHIGINKQDKANIAEEALDTIQVCIGILDKLEAEGLNIEQMFHRHNKKLINRHWTGKGVVDIKWFRNV